jgi:hypothetical protein
MFIPKVELANEGSPKIIFEKCFTNEDTTTFV